MCVWILLLDKLVVPGHSQLLYYSGCVCVWCVYCYWINWLYLATHSCFITLCVYVVCMCMVRILLLDKLVVPGHSQVLYYLLCVCVFLVCVVTGKIG